jgi:hypothetical protein
MFKDYSVKKIKFPAKLKKTGSNCKGFPKVEEPGCNFGKTQGFICKSARLRRGDGSDPSDPHPTIRIKGGSVDRYRKV